MVTDPTTLLITDYAIYCILINHKLTIWGGWHDKRRCRGKKSNVYFLATTYYLKMASALWPDMQSAGHAAVAVYRNCPETNQIRPKDAPGGFDYFKFWPAVTLVRG